MKIKLSHYQEHLLLSLNEPNWNPDGTWYFARRDLRTLRILAGYGLAEQTDVSPYKVGYRLTPAGKERAEKLEASS